MSSYEDAAIEDDAAAQDTNDALIGMLDDVDANEVVDGSTSDAEGDGYECVVSFEDGMKEVDLEH